jgi:capsular exopolysaccharide synthesis family protein
MLPTPEPGDGSANLPVAPSPSRSRLAIPEVSLAPVSIASHPDPIALLKALRRRWLLALSAGLFCAAVAAGAAYLVAPAAKYTARAMLHVNSVQPQVILKTREVSSDYGAFQRTQLALIKSRFVLEAALKIVQDGVYKLPAIVGRVDAIEWLDKELQVDFANGSEILRISMTGVEAVEPMVLVNAVTQAYLDEIVDAETKKRRERYDLLKDTWNRYQESLRERRKELRRLTEQAGADDKKTLANLQQHELDRLGRAEEELARVQSEVKRLRVDSAVLREEETLSDKSVTPAMIEDEINNDRTIEQLAERLTHAQKWVDQTARTVRIKSDPALQKHQRDLKSAQDALKAQRAKLYPIIARQLQAQSRSDLSERTARMDARIRILAGLEDSLTEDVKRLAERSRSFTRNALDLSSIQEEIGTSVEIAKTIGAEVESLNVELLAPPRIWLIEKAELPRTKDEMGPIRMAGMAGGGTFALVLVGISLWEFRARRIDSADEVVHALGLNLVGTLPARPARNRLRGSGGAHRQQWQSLLSESVDAARTALLHASRAESIRAVMITSALGGEGKTSVSCHLAASLARADRRTLLIDGDLRRPATHRVFGLPQGPGLSEVLRGEHSFADVAQPALANGLWLVPAGHSDGEAIRALASVDLRAMLGRLKEDYDFIVVDSSPVLPVADALLIGQHVDGVLFSVMRDVSRLPKVHAACARLSSLGIRMLGAIITGTRGDLYGSAYQSTTPLEQA